MKKAILILGSTLLLSSNMFAQSKCNCQEDTINCELITYAKECNEEATNKFREYQDVGEKISPLLEEILTMWFYKTWKDYDGIRKKTNRSKNACYIEIMKCISNLPSYQDWIELNRRDRKQYNKNNKEDRHNIDNEYYKEIYKRNESFNPLPTIDTKKDEVKTSLEQIVTKVEDTLKHSSDSIIQLSIYPKVVISTLNIYFKEGEFVLDQNDKNVINALKLDDATEIIIEGFASKTGTRSTNFAISMSRCYAVKKYIVEQHNYQNDIILVPVGLSEDSKLRAVTITVKK